MTPCKPLVRKIALFVFVFAAISFNRASAQDGKQLFNGKCASCHQIFKDATGPALMGLEERHTWSDHNEILKWAHNPTAYMAKDP
jgi:cytochrome c2